MAVAFLGLGSNLADKKNNIIRAIGKIGDISGLRIKAVSSLYSGSALGVTNQPDFANAVIKIETSLDPHSLLKTMQAIEDANVVILVVEARDQITEQDAHLADFVLQAGRALVLAVNKWDGLDAYQRDTAKRDIDRKLHFLSFAKHHFISALKGDGVQSLFKSVDEAYAAAMAKLPTPLLTRVLIDAVDKQQPPRGGVFRPKMRYAHQGGSNPPLIIIHGSALDKVPESYRRYLEKTFCDAFKLQGTPLKVEFRAGANPFADNKPKKITESERREGLKLADRVRKRAWREPNR